MRLLAGQGDRGAAHHPRRRGRADRGGRHHPGPGHPYAWARSLAGQLESGRLVTYDGDGHTAYGRHDDCVDSAVNRYLVEGQPPANGLRCS